jgi:hypothetical protein
MVDVAGTLSADSEGAGEVDGDGWSGEDAS